MDLSVSVSTGVFIAQYTVISHTELLNLQMVQLWLWEYDPMISCPYIFKYCLYYDCDCENNHIVLFVLMCVCICLLARMPMCVRFVSSFIVSLIKHKVEVLVASLHLFKSLYFYNTNSCPEEHNCDPCTCFSVLRKAAF